MSLLIQYSSYDFCTTLERQYSSCEIYHIHVVTFKIACLRFFVSVPVPNVQLKIGSLPVGGQTRPVTAGVPVPLNCIPGFSRPSATIDWYIQSSQTQTSVRTQTSPNTEYILTAEIDNHLDQIFCQAYIPGQVLKADSAKLTLYVNGKSFYRYSNFFCDFFKSK